MSTSVIKALTETHDLIQLNKNLEEKPKALLEELTRQKDNISINKYDDSVNPFVLTNSII